MMTSVKSISIVVAVCIAAGCSDPRQFIFHSDGKVAIGFHSYPPDGRVREFAVRIRSHGNGVILDSLNIDGYGAPFSDVKLVSGDNYRPTFDSGGLIEISFTMDASNHTVLKNHGKSLPGDRYPQLVCIEYYLGNANSRSCLSEREVISP